MTFGAAILTTPKRRKPQAWNKGRTMSHALLVDCGEHGPLGVAEIARRAGVDPDTIRKRMREGVTGAALLAPKGRGHTRVPQGAAEATLLTAARLALHFGERRPTVREILAVQPMSHQTALRYCRAMLRAHDERDAKVAA